MIVIAGPCVIDERVYEIAERLVPIFGKYQECDCYFKASYDKANRTSLASYRGPGVERGLEVLNAVKNRFNLKTTTDVHTEWQAEHASKVVDVVQIPALLSRQTDLLVAAGSCAEAVNIKKGQFMAPQDAKWAVEKVKVAGCRNVSVIERGTSFGYQRLIVDMLNFVQIQALTGVPVIFDCTHSLQLPGAGFGCSASVPRDYAKTLAWSAIAANADGLFLEVYPNPDQAKCDGPNSVTIEQLDIIIKTALEVRHAVRQRQEKRKEEKG